MKTPEDLAKETLLKKFKFNPNTWTDFHTAFIYGYDAAKPEWISVKERLPEEGQECIFYVDFVDEWDKGSERINFQEIGVFNGKDRFDHRSHTDLDRVTYWMLLPKSPEEA